MTDYRLLVDMLVAEEKTDQFEQVMGEFLARGAFRFFHPRFDNELVLALRGPEPSLHSYAKLRPGAARDTRDPAARFLVAPPRVTRDQPSQVDVPMRRYVHLWSVPDMDDLDLAARMQFCSEDELYMHLDELVTQETQQFVRRVRWQQQPCKPKSNMNFVRVTRQLGYKNLGRCLLQLRALLPFLEVHGWENLGQFQAITGTLNMTTEFWQTKNTEAFDVHLFDDQPGLLRRANEVATLPTSVQFEMFDCAPYCVPGSGDGSGDSSSPPIGARSVAGSSV
jgi:hypothetical protein